MSCKDPDDCKDVLKALQTEGVDFAATSPLYWNLRDYRTEPLTWAAEAARSEREKRTGITSAISVINHCRSQGILEDAVRNA